MLLALGQATLTRYVIFGHRRRGDHGGLLVAGTVAAKLRDGRFGSPSFENVDSARVEQVRRDREVEAAGRTAGLRDDVRAIGQIVVAHVLVDDQMPRDD